MAKKSLRKTRALPITIFFIILSLILLIALIIVSVVKDREIKNASTFKKCDNTAEEIDIAESANPTIFRDLTEKELNAVFKYLKSQESLKIVSDDKITPNSSYVYLVELRLPSKKDALEYLDNNGKAPERWARAMLLRTDVTTPQAEEYKVGPLPIPNNHSLIRTINYDHKPATEIEVLAINLFLKELDSQLSPLLTESYGTKLANCEPKKCLRPLFSPISTAHSDQKTRKFALSFFYDIEFYSLHPVDFTIVVECRAYGYKFYSVYAIWYNQQSFKTVGDLMFGYNNNSPGFKKMKLQPPNSNENQTLFSNLRVQHENNSPKQSPPEMYEPNGKRYKIKDRYVSYMDWSFNIRLSTAKGPALNNVRYRGSRIAYELSLQEISVFYSANSPTMRMANYLDSFMLIGYLSRVLVAGYDCPRHATFIPSLHIVDGRSKPFRFDHALCIFEQNTGVPLHRHRSPGFYGGMMSSMLVFRTITTVENYDYIIDFNFYQSGTLEVKIHSTGYILTTFMADAEKPYGWRLRDTLHGPIHHHLFHIKADLDIEGTENRFEKLNIKPRKIPDDWSAQPGSKLHLMEFERQLIKTENEARYKYNFDTPTYLIFHNKNSKTETGLPRAYRLHPAGISKWLFPEDKGAETSVSWARQQVAVTRYKENETYSSSIYGSFDGDNPTVIFDDFISDENIVDEDLVAWVTLGVHHIPHTEDLPVTPTDGAGLTFTLSPYNYFPVCPSMTSRDGIYIRKDENGYAKVQETGISNDEMSCKADVTNFIKLIRNDPRLVFD